jgi:hypothetical protein
MGRGVVEAVPDGGSSHGARARVVDNVTWVVGGLSV